MLREGAVSAWMAGLGAAECDAGDGVNWVAWEYN